MSMIGNLCLQLLWPMFFKLCKIWGKSYTSVLFHPKNQAIKVTSRCFFNIWIQGNQGQTTYHVCLYPGTQHVDNAGNSLRWRMKDENGKRGSLTSTITSGSIVSPTAGHTTWYASIPWAVSEGRSTESPSLNTYLSRYLKQDKKLLARNVHNDLINLTIPQYKLNLSSPYLDLHNIYPSETRYWNMILKQRQANIPSIQTICN